jgi:two-component system NtrC family sensor kinase
MAKETVLIIDDSAELRSVLENVLSFGSYKVLSASTGQEGFGLVQQEQPDLIMVDLELPDTNGLKVLEKLNEHGLTIPTIMMTGYGSEGVAARALRLGVRDYLVKPFTTDEVLSSVERALAESRLRREKVQLTAFVNGYLRHIQMVSTIGRSLTAGLALDEALRRIVATGMSVTRAEDGFLLLVDEQSRVLRVTVAEGRAEHPPERFAQLSGDQRLRPVLQQGVAVRLLSSDAKTIELQTGDQVRAVLQVPLLAPDRALGLLSVDRPTTNTPFSKYDEQILMILADYALLGLYVAGDAACEGKPAGPLDLAQAIGSGR